jgi:hypothetical protein
MEFKHIDSGQRKHGQVRTVATRVALRKSLAWGLIGVVSSSGARLESPGVLNVRERRCFCKRSSSFISGCRIGSSASVYFLNKSCGEGNP